MNWFRQAIGLLIGACSFLYLIFVLNTIQILSLPIFLVAPNFARAINRWCGRSIWGFWVLQAEVMNGIEIRFTGLPLPRRENVVVMTNHQSMADVLVLLSLAWRCGRLGDLKCFVKDVVKYFPGFGWGMYMLNFIFVKRDWAKDHRSIRRLFEKYRVTDIPIFLVSFLEGTRRTPKKAAVAERFAKQRGLPVPRHTLIPRTKGFVATLEGLGDKIDAVYDVTIGYPQGPTSLVDCYRGTVRRIEVHVERFLVKDLPKDPAQLEAWVQTRFQHKDELLEELKKNGRFSGAEWPKGVHFTDWFVAEHRAPQRIS